MDKDAADREREIGRLLQGAMDLPAREQRAFLESVSDNPELVEEALGLLALDTEEASTFLEPPAARLLASSRARAQEGEEGGVATESDRPGEPRDRTGPAPRGRVAPGRAEPRQIGPYSVLGPLGEGGMGLVYRAIQHQPIERQVAIKVMAEGSSGPEARRRFDLERQALGRLTHPNIARLYEAGTTEDGRPFVVMELVEGLRITQFCDLRGLSIAHRLRLFVDICRGIQHAHQNQILHRDLKPANLLVTESETGPVAKVIDFGIARDLELPTDHTFATGHRLVGTPHYMSPEALRRSESKNLDTRTDLYSLGVVLYELLVGVRPFETSAEDLPKLLRDITESPPKRPSARLAELDDATRYRLAANRGLEPEAHRQALDGDLDWVIAKAMERDRERRYGSATELADEVERVLTHRPIEARPPTFLYRSRKWVRRHRSGAVLGGLAVFGLIAAVLLAASSLRRAQRAEAQSRLDAEVSRETLAFILDLFDAVSSDGSLPQNATLEDVLSQGAESLGQSELPPTARAQVLETLGEAHLRLGFFPRARELLAESLEIRERALPEDARDTVRAARLLGNLERRAGRPDVAEPLLLRVLAAAETRGDARPLELADAVGSLGNLRWSQGRLDEALTLHRRALALRQTHLGGEDESVGVSHNNLGTLFYSSSKPREAEPHLRRAHAIFEAQLGPRHPRVATALGNLALVLQLRGAVGEAERIQRRIVDIQRDAFGDDHPATATAVHNLAGLLLGRGQTDEAATLYGSALERRRRILGPAHPETIRSQTGLGRCAWRAKDYPRAEALLRESLELLESRGEGDGATAHRLRRYLAVVQRDTGELAGARRALLRVLEWQEQTLGEDRFDVPRTLRDLGVTEGKLGLLDEAERTLRRAMALQRRLGTGSGSGDIHYADTLFALGEVLRQRGHPDGDRYLSEALELRRTWLPNGHPDLAPAGAMDAEADAVASGDRS
ncbi:MAG: serine/threonine-protein kinase [Acidobacteriota bacterium]